MSMFFVILALVAWLFFLIDGKEFTSVMGQGGWVAICLYIVLGILITNVILTPDAVVAGAEAVIHH